MNNLTNQLNNETKKRNKMNKLGNHNKKTNLKKNNKNIMSLK